jgi:hypothetical protein
MAGLFAQWERWRKIYRRLPFIVRSALVVLAFVLGPLGVLAMFTPLAVLEIGSLLVFTSLTILSFEFDWAYRLLLGLRRTLEDARIRRRLLIFTGCIVLIYIAIIGHRLLAR